MAKIRFENGTVVNFDGDPTPEDVEEVAQKLNLKSGGFPLPPEKSQVSFGEFAAKDILGLGTRQETGTFPRDILQSTIGSCGIAGTFQMPSRLGVSDYIKPAYVKAK